MNGLVFVPQHNEPGKADATGVFLPEAKRIADLHGFAPDRIHAIDNHLTLSQRFDLVLARVRAAVERAESPIDSLVFCCHGWSSGIQMGIVSANVGTFIGAFGGALARDVVVALYCCSTGTDTHAGPGGEGGFADRLRDELCCAGSVDCRVMGHTEVAHATRSPHARTFAGAGSATGGRGGEWVVAPSSELWDTWRAELRDVDDADGPGGEPATSLRWRFPWMPLEQIHAELREQQVVTQAGGGSPPPSVRVLQRVLRGAGSPELVVDGRGGPRTRAALRRWQAERPPLVADGRFGPRTWAAMRAAGLLP